MFSSRVEDVPKPKLNALLFDTATPVTSGASHDTNLKVTPIDNALGCLPACLLARLPIGPTGWVAG